MSVTIIEDLRSRRKGLLDEMRGIQSGAEAADRDLTSEEAQEFERRESDFEAITARVERLENSEERASLVQSHNPATEEVAQTVSADPAEEAELRTRAFESLVRSRGRIESLPQEQRAALQVGTDSEGGFTVPDEFYRSLVVAEREIGTIRGLASTITTSDNGDLQIPGTSTRATAAWTAEEVAYTQSESTFKQTILKAHKVGALSKVSDELLEDSAFDILGFLATDLGEAIGIKENNAFAVGAASSTTTPKGIFNLAPVGFTGAVSASAVISGDDLIETFHALGVPYRSRASWLIADGTVKAIRKLKDGDNQYLWQPGLQAGAPDMLLGKAAYSDPDAVAMAPEAQSIVFGDLKSYWIRDVEGVTVKVLNELYAVNGQVGFRISRRTDGTLADTAAVTSFKHGDAS